MRMSIYEHRKIAVVVNNSSNACNEALRGDYQKSWKQENIQVKKKKKLPETQCIRMYLYEWSDLRCLYYVSTREMIIMYAAQLHELMALVKWSLDRARNRRSWFARTLSLSHMLRTHIDLNLRVPPENESVYRQLPARRKARGSWFEPPVSPPAAPASSRWSRSYALQSFPLPNAWTMNCSSKLKRDQAEIKRKETRGTIITTKNSPWRDIIFTDMQRKWIARKHASRYLGSYRQL